MYKGPIYIAQVGIEINVHVFLWGKWGIGVVGVCDWKVLMVSVMCGVMCDVMLEGEE